MTQGSAVWAALRREMTKEFGPATQKVEQKAQLISRSPAISQTGLPVHTRSQVLIKNSTGKILYNRTCKHEEISLYVERAKKFASKNNIVLSQE